MVLREGQGYREKAVKLSAFSAGSGAEVRYQTERLHISDASVENEWAGSIRSWELLRVAI